MSEFPPIIKRERAPFRDAPFIALPNAEKLKTHPLAKKVRGLAISMLGGEKEVRLDLESGKAELYIISAQACNFTGYKGAEVLIEKWRPDSEDPECNVRDFSIAFYSDLVINRPNYTLCYRVTYSDGSFKIVVGGSAPEGFETYEVGSKELNRLLRIMREPLQYRLTERFF